MLDPAEYCRRLAARVDALDAANADGADKNKRFYVVVEKILARHESLRVDWPIDGTTGYDVLNLINGLFVRPDAEEPLTAIYRRFIDRPLDFDAELYRSKKLVMDHVLASELQVLANELDKLSESQWRTRDFTLIALRDALKEVAACFPVYRTYVDDKGITAEDRRDIDWAVSQARKRSEDKEDTIFDFIHDMLTTDTVRKRRPNFARRAVIRFAMRFQQYTGPVMAKSLEDTSFYRWHRLLSLNEVGGDPRRFAVTPSAFHHQMQDRARRWPRAMTATTTHDTKRGEDARARLDVLSETAEEWGTRVERWATFNRRFKTQQDESVVPTANDEYLIYQLLLGAWPNELSSSATLDDSALESFLPRVEGSVIKSLREAKQQTSWARPDSMYEEAVLGFLRGILDPARSPQFLADFSEFAGRIAWFGMLNSLSQTVLKLAVPGIPDTYQGADLWDYAMVDPDNRRPVDFTRRETLLQSLDSEIGSGELAEDTAASLIANWTDGRIKLLMLTRLLHLRRRLPGLFLSGSYQSLAVDGPRADHLCAFAFAFACAAGTATLVVAVPRFFMALCDGATRLPSSDVWRDTMVILPAELRGNRLTNVLTGEEIEPTAHETWPAVAMEQALSRLPWGVWLVERPAA